MTKIKSTPKVAKTFKSGDLIKVFGLYNKYDGVYMITDDVCIIEARVNLYSLNRNVKEDFSLRWFKISLNKWEKIKP